MRGTILHMQIDPRSWNTSRKVALVFAALFGGCMGLIFAANLFDEEDGFYWLALCLWGGAGAAAAFTGHYIVQLLRNRKP